MAAFVITSQCITTLLGLVKAKSIWLLNFPSCDSQVQYLFVVVAVCFVCLFVVVVGFFFFFLGGGGAFEIAYLHD